MATPLAALMAPGICPRKVMAPAIPSTTMRTEMRYASRIMPPEMPDPPTGFAEGRRDTIPAAPSSHAARRSAMNILRMKLVVVACLASVSLALAQEPTRNQDTVDDIRKAILRLPYYGVFD